MLGWRPRDLQHAYLPFLKGEGVATYFSDPVFRGALEKPPEQDPGPAIAHWAYQFANPSVTWDDLGWLREQTKLPIVLKGIVRCRRRATRRRGGRGRVDRLQPRRPPGRRSDRRSRALPLIRDALGHEFPVLFDSGIRTGADIFKALALGANAVCLGRPYVWGLALGGQAGVEHVLRCLLAELDLTLALSGYTNVEQVTRSAVRRSA